MKKFVIVAFEDITLDMVKVSNGNKLSDLRFNNDKTKAVLSFDLQNHAPFLGFSWLEKNSVEEVLAEAEWQKPASLIESFVNFFKV